MSLLVRGRSHQPADVLFGLLLEDLAGIVAGDHTDQGAAVVHHGQGLEVVARDQDRGLFLVLACGDRDGDLGHHVAHGRVDRRGDQVAIRDPTDGLVGAVHDEESGLLLDRVLVLLAQGLDRVADVGVGPDRREVGGHHAAGGVRGVAAQAAQVRGPPVLGALDDLLGNPKRRVVQQVHGLVHTEGLHDLDHFIRREQRHEHRLDLVGRKLEDVCPGLVVQGPEDRHDVFVRPVLHPGRNVRGVHLLQKTGEIWGVVHQQLPQGPQVFVGVVIGVWHGASAQDSLIAGQL